MPANWSLILNVLLLIGVIVAIGRLMKARRKAMSLANDAAPSMSPGLGKIEHKYSDDIIAVRKIPQDFSDELLADTAPSVERLSAKAPVVSSKTEIPIANNNVNVSGQSIMMFLSARENRKLAGYELLQTVLAAGLRFGEGHFFHRHQNRNGQGPVLCSLAAATATGMFDLQNIGAFSVRGLCLYMHSSGNSVIDAERLSIMLETAKQLSADLDTHLLDDKQQPLTEESMLRYCQLLNIKDSIPLETEEACC